MLRLLKLIYTGTGLVFFLLSSCSYSQQRALTSTSAPGLTQAYKTIYTKLTIAAQVTPNPTRTPTAAATSTLTPTISPTTRVSASPAPGASATSIALPVNLCDRAAPGVPFDVSIEDDTQMEPGQRFTKTWRFINNGSCTWSQQYQAIWFSGARLGDVREASLPGEVAPGKSVDISIDMVAPEEPGTHQSNWKLQNAAGVSFGIGPNGNSPFWVRIHVIELTSTPVLAMETPSPTSTDTPTATSTATLVETPTEITSEAPVETPVETPTETATTPAIFINGSIVLAPGDSLDLDNGVPPESDEADLAYTTGEGDIHWLTPQQNATLGMYGNNQPSLGACMNASTGPAPIAVESLSPGMFLCYRTNEGRAGWLRLNQFDPAIFSITIDVLTWAVP